MELWLNINVEEQYLGKQDPNSELNTTISVKPTTITNLTLGKYLKP